MQMRKSRRRKYRLLLMAFLVLDLSAVALLGYRELDRSVPDEIYLEKGSTQDLEETLAKPLLSFSDTVQTSGDGSYLLCAKLLGRIPFKTVKVVPTEEKYVSLSGETVGIYLATNGVLVVDTGEILTEDGTRTIPAENLVRSGDYIVAMNGRQISTKKELMDELAVLDQENVTLDIRRDEEVIPVSVIPAKDTEGNYKLGIWVRDDTQGIGTLTYVDQDGNFGALGHGISDTDTGGLVSIQKGALYQAEIISILKGRKGNPGELSGMIRYDAKEFLGTIAKNTENGIYGTLTAPAALQQNLITQICPVGYKQELKEGPAQILCHVEDQVRSYDAEITQIELNHEDSNKSFIIRVTDETLLEETGGIVQGLSGSPVIQNGKFVGAITHVFVQDSATGYGIFAETMLKEQELS